MSDSTENKSTIEDQEQTTTVDDVVDTYIESIDKALESRQIERDEILANAEIVDAKPHPLNLTWIICTSIVALAAIIILCVAPRKSREISIAVTDTTVVEEQKPTTEPTTPTSENVEEQTNVKPISPAKRAAMNADPETVTVRNEEQVLPLIECKKTNSNNRLNGVRVVNLSKRPLTETEVNQLTKDELYLSRNANYAIHGYQFKNSELKEFFDAQSWFKSTNRKIDEIESKWTTVEKDNINLIREREKQLK